MGRVLILGIFAALLMPAAAAGGGQPPSHPRCHTRDLGATIGPASVGAGQRYATLFLRNGSAHTCRTYGHVGLRLLDRHAHRLPTKVVRVLGERRRPISIVPGGQALAQLHWGAIRGPGEPASVRCEPTPFLIEVTPPNETRQLVAGWHGGPVCEHGRIELTPLRIRR